MILLMCADQERFVSSCIPSNLNVETRSIALVANSQYLVGCRFKIYTDHISNTWVQNLKHSQGKLCRWSLRLQNYSFEISHLPGAKMPADYISPAVEIVDSSAPDLDDDSVLVFATDTVDDEPPVTTLCTCVRFAHQSVAAIPQ